MNFFAVSGYVIFSLSIINIWKEKFILHNLEKYENYLFEKISHLVNATSCDINQLSKNYANSLMFFVGTFGLNAVLHSIKLYMFPLKIIMYSLNVLCFFLHCSYMMILPLHIMQDYNGLHLKYNFFILLCLNCVYFLTPSDVTYFEYFVIITVPYFVKSYFKLYNYHYEGNNAFLKTVDFYLNYF